MIVPLGRFLLGAQRVVLLAREEVGVPRNDLRLLARLLLPHPDGAHFLRALEEISVETFLELHRGQSCQVRPFLDSQSFQRILVTTPMWPHLHL
jgi:hypothetical protein